MRSITERRENLNVTLKWMAPEMLQNINVAPDELPRRLMQSDMLIRSQLCLFLLFLYS